MNANPIWGIDGYKLGHIQQYPKGQTFLFENFTPRSNKHFNTPWPWGEAGSPLVASGIQTFAQQWLFECFDKYFFNKKRKKIVKEFQKFVNEYLDRDVNLDHIDSLHRLGYLPITIKAVPEGDLVSMGTPLFTVHNTHEDYAWLCGFLEDLMSNENWPVATAATIAFNYKLICSYWAAKTCDNDFHVPYQCHDFSSRGDMGFWAATLVGVGHLMSFIGTDNVPAAKRVREGYLNAKDSSANVAKTIPASEHSTTTTNINLILGHWEQGLEWEGYTKESFPAAYVDGEDRLKAEACYLHYYITKLYPTGLCSYVMDSYDFWGMVEKVLPILRDVIVSREGKLVVRPDTGNPADVICGNPNAEHDTCEYYGLVISLSEIFGFTINDKGMRIINDHIGIIYGDSITLDRADDIFRRMYGLGFASSNVVFGVGSFTYQYVTRDTFGFAVKATATTVDGTDVMVYKQPKTDSGKNSLKGLITHYQKNHLWCAVDQQSQEQFEKYSLLPVVFADSEVAGTASVYEIRKRIDEHVKRIVGERLANEQSI
ncbi:nicotinamide phosphoribosyl transferase [Aeromonas phage BUCT695]|uniref:nicotinamide phosphoribosyl transferase n=1 Tax=Aeromonas phage BUCT695 TaxID=2908630 RepID=UPI0023293964|nr:nicotinamide phosphoribosyl transferase [Aeromonas phage BUCT695]UIW10486.1 nicotinamide phosphoribosyl transferase [Aeromonas phage BUCT695]